MYLGYEFPAFPGDAFRSIRYGELRGKCYGDFRNRVARLHFSYPERWHTLKSMGLDAVMKLNHRSSFSKSLLTKCHRRLDEGFRLLESYDSKVMQSSDNFSVSSPRVKGSCLSYDALRMRKLRLLDRLKCFVGASSRCYFFTVTARDGDMAASKRDFLYAFENVRRLHQRKYGKMHYVGVLERHPRRKRHPFHAHFCVFFDSGYKDYKELWETIGRLGRIDMDPMKSRGIPSLAAYSVKSLVDTINSYLHKTEAPECHLLVSKGSPKPQRMELTGMEAEMLKSSMEERVKKLPGGVEAVTFYSGNWPELEKILLELRDIERQEGDILAEEFIRSPTHNNHRR